jgi:hypothetical protein
MSDQSDLTLTPPPLTPMPNDAAARSSTGEILEPSQIKATPATVATTVTPPPAPTSTPPDPAAKPDAPKPATTPGAPEAYAAFTAPEGYTLDAAVIDAATPIFKELGLSQEAAQKLVEFHSKAMIEAAKAPQSTYETMRNEWTAKAKADPDMAKASVDGKTGLEAVKLDMGRALTALGDPTLAKDFKEAMDLTGAGDHPAFIKTFWKLAQFVTEGKAVTPGNPSPHGQRPPGQSERPAPAAALYPHLAR